MLLKLLKQSTDLAKLSEQQSSYRQIFKATSILGGVQVFTIIISVLRSKAIAVLLGPAGMGIVAIYTSTIGLIAQVTNFGLGTSAVKNIAIASESGDAEKLAKTTAVFTRLVWLTGFLGFIVALALSPFLSEIAFGHKKFTLGFVILSITLLFTQITAGQNVILQGMRKIQYMAKATAFGSFIGLIISIPFYYFMHDDGIVPAMVLTSIATLAVSWYYVKKVNIPKWQVEKDVFKTEGKEMLRMGFLISFSGIITLAVAYIVRIYISNSGGLKDVGLFTAGFAIINTYVGMVFSAMASDYYPRLSNVAHDNKLAKATINEQAEIAVLILAPILVAFLVFVNWGVIILYSKDFTGVIPMVHWATLGIFFKALSWSIAFIFLAKGASKAFFWNEVLANVYILITNILGYYYFGLTGLGISFLVSYLIYFIQVLWISNKLYHFQLSSSTIKIFGFQFAIALICFVAVYYFNTYVAYSVGVVMIIISGWFSFKELEERLKFVEIIKTKLKGRKNGA